MRDQGAGVVMAAIGLTLAGGVIPTVRAGEARKPGVYFRTLSAASQTEYGLLVPDDYAEHTTRSWPLIVALHYSTGSGADYLAYWQEEAEKRRYFVFAPDARDARGWSTAEAGEIIQTLDQLCREFRIDRERILLTGNSAGGHYTYYLALRYPERFAAAAPIAASYQRFADEIRPSTSARRVKFCIVHGEQDDRVPVSEAYHTARLLRDQGLSVKLMVFPQDDHYGIYRCAEILDWFESLRGPR